MLFAQWIPEGSIRSSETGVTDIYELPCGVWDSNPGPSEEQPMHLPDELPYCPHFKRSSLVEWQTPNLILQTRRKYKDL